MSFGKNMGFLFHALFIITHRSAGGLLPEDPKNLIFYAFAMDKSLNLKRILLRTGIMILSRRSINCLRLLVDWLFTNTVLGTKVLMWHKGR